MSTDPDPRVGEVLPTDAWNILKSDVSARLIDVRTQAEWAFVGAPDLTELNQTPLFVEWVSFPDMSRNPRFADTLSNALGSQIPGTLLFMCRSGARSLHAAHAVSAWYAEQGQTANCVNVAQGFEGDLNTQGQRGIRNGWKHHGLAWRQT